WAGRVVLVVALLLLLWWLAPVAIVPSGHRGVMTTFGKPASDVYEEGIHLRLPLAQVLHHMDVRIQKGEADGDAASRDLPSVHTKIAINYPLEPKAAPQAFREIAQTTDE